MNSGIAVDFRITIKTRGINKKPTAINSLIRGISVINRYWSISTITVYPRFSRNLLSRVANGTAIFHEYHAPLIYQP